MAGSPLGKVIGHAEPVLAVLTAALAAWAIERGMPAPKFLGSIEGYDKAKSLIPLAGDLIDPHCFVDEN